MEKKMTFNYFYGTEADLFSFYRIPKALFTDSYFKDLSSDAKILYGLMLDRMSLSIRSQKRCRPSGAQRPDERTQHPPRLPCRGVR